MSEFLCKLKAALSCALLAALIGLAIEAMIAVHEVTEATRALPILVSEVLQETEADLVDQVTAARADLAGELAAARHDAIGQIAALRQDATATVKESLTVADRRVGDTLSHVDTALDKVEEIRQDLKPALDHTASIAAQVDDAAPLWLDCESNPDCAFNRYQGAAKAIERAAEDTSSMTGDFRRALPTTLDAFDHILKNSDKTTEASAKMMQNFARATKPLPAYIRIPLSVTGAVAPTAAGIIGAAAATGAFH